MATTPADPPPPLPLPAADARRAPDWTTTREVALDCTGCGARYVLAYKYRFAEGLAATRLRCPDPSCRRPREYYLPVNAFDVVVAFAPAPGAPPPGR